MKTRLLHLAAIAALCSGCVVAAVAAAAGVTYGAIQYANNEAYRDFEAELPVIWRATVDALESQGYGFQDPGHAPTEGEIEVDDTRVRVERQPGGITRVRVRVGTFDTEENKRRAELILEDVAAQLG